MGCGKSTVGKKLARKLNFKFIDIDTEIEKNQGKSIAEIFKIEGETEFRNLERNFLIDTFTLDNVVVSCGGGLPCFFDNMDLINTHGISVYLKMSPKSLHNRLIPAKTTRPLLQNKTDEEILPFIEETLALREQFYNKAQFVVKGENLDVFALIELLNL